MARTLEIRAEFGVIEDFPVIDNPQVAVLISKRLMSAADIDDAQTAMAKFRQRVVIETRIVGAAMADCIRHALERTLAIVMRRRGWDEPVHAATRSSLPIAAIH